MNQKPLISVIMNCFNGQDYLDEALKSILNQTYENWELIFWDNCSTDNSANIFNKFKDQRFKYFSATNHTILYKARNLAAQKALGDFITFLDTDDVWLPKKLEKQIKLFQESAVGLVYGNCWQHNENNIFKKRKIFSKKKLPKGMITKSLIDDYKVGLLTIMIRRAFIKDIKNIFDVNYDLLADFDFVIKFSMRYKFDCIQEPVAIYRRHPNQLQRKFFEKQIDQFEKWFVNNSETLKHHSYNNLSSIKNKIQYMKILKLIDEKKYLQSFLKIAIYPFSLNKLKLIIIYMVPNFILKYYRDYT